MLRTQTHRTSRRRKVEAATIAALVRSLPEYLTPGAPRLTAKTFARIGALEQAELPPAQRFPVAGAVLGYRHYFSLGARTAVVLIHGSGCFGDLFHALAGEIASSGAAHVLTLDMRGHGLSEGPRGCAIEGPGQVVQDVQAFVRFVRAGLAARTVVLGGHSAGAGILLRFAASPAAEEVDAYLFLAPFLGLGAPTNRPRFGGWVRPRLPALSAAIAANLLGVTALNDRIILDFDREPAADQRYLAGWSLATLDAFAPPWTGDGPRIPDGQPVLVLGLKDDECFDAAGFPSAFAGIAPHASIPELGPGGHWDLLVDPGAIEQARLWTAGLAASAAAAARPRRRRSVAA